MESSTAADSALTDIAATLRIIRASAALIAEGRDLDPVAEALAATTLAEALRVLEGLEAGVLGASVALAREEGYDRGYVKGLAAALAPPSRPLLSVLSGG